MNEIIDLIDERFHVNELGDQVKERTRRTVFATLKSIRQSEFYQAAAVGLKPEIVFVLADFLDYHGEELLEYKPYGMPEPIEYKVLRTYRADNSMELVCTRGVEK